MTKEQKKLARKHLMNKYGTRWASEVARQTGFTPTYIRIWFRTDLVHPKIQGSVVELVRLVKRESRRISEMVSH